MTAPDPLVCMDLLAAGQAPECGESTTAHCSSCKGCPDACTCPPLPAVGTQILAKPGTVSNGVAVPQLPLTVVATWDHRRDGEPLDYVIVCQASCIVRHMVDRNEPINTQYGAYLGLDDIQVLDDAPRITFTAKEN
jgi:hypothetical protein